MCAGQTLFVTLNLLRCGPSFAINFGPDQFSTSTTSWHINEKPLRWTSLVNLDSFSSELGALNSSISTSLYSLGARLISEPRRWGILFDENLSLALETKLQN